MTFPTKPPALQTDARIASHLKGNAQVCPRNLQVRTRFGKLFIEGEVDSWFAKQVAQESIRNFDGVDQIENRLTVTR